MKLYENVAPKTYLPMVYDTIEDIIDIWPQWGYTGGSNIRSLLFHPYSLNLTLANIIDRFTNDVVIGNKAVPILNTLYITDKAVNLYLDNGCIYGLQHGGMVWIIQPSQGTLKNLRQNTHDIGSYVDDIQSIITSINMDIKIVNFSTTGIIHKYINTL